MIARGRWALALAVLTGCGGTPPAERTGRCDPPLAFEWVAEPREATFGAAPSCEGVELLSGPSGLAVRVDGAEVGATRAPDAVAFRDAEGVGWVGADWRRRFSFRPPGEDEELLAGRAPRDALQWGLSGVHVGPDGWWIVTWASWVGDHEELRPSVTRVFFVSRESLRAVPVEWPALDPARLEMRPRAGGLDVTVEDGRAFEVRWRPGCGSGAARLDSPPPRCETWAAEAPMCFGRC